MKYLLPLLALIISLLLSLPAEASMPICRKYSNHQICILSIKRSAKNYWEYRASVRVNGVTRPVEVYNCRDRTYIQNDGKILSFKHNSPGSLICSFFSKQ